MLGAGSEADGDGCAWEEVETGGASAKRFRQVMHGTKKANDLRGNRPDGGVGTGWPQEFARFARRRSVFIIL
jgi:hypothetical protein